MSAIDRIKKESHGFITSPDELAEVIAENRLAPVLVRCGGGRFTCPAQDVNHFLGIILRDGTDYVRDMSVK